MMRRSAMSSNSGKRVVSYQNLPGFIAAYGYPLGQGRAVVETPSRRYTPMKRLLVPASPMKAMMWSVFVKTSRPWFDWYASK